MTTCTSRLTMPDRIDLICSIAIVFFGTIIFIHCVNYGLRGI